MRFLAPPRFIWASTVQLKVSQRGLMVLGAKSMLSNSLAKRRREVVVRKVCERTKQATRKKIQAIKRQKQEARLP